MIGKDHGIYDMLLENTQVPSRSSSAVLSRQNPRMKMTWAWPLEGSLRIQGRTFTLSSRYCHQSFLPRISFGTHISKSTYFIIYIGNPSFPLLHPHRDDDLFARSPSHLFICSAFFFRISFARGFSSLFACSSVNMIGPGVALRCSFRSALGWSLGCSSRDAIDSEGIWGPGCFEAIL